MRTPDKTIIFILKFADDIKNALHVLRDGGLILYPTDTIWGIGCDATNNEAIDLIYKIKKRSDKKSLLILLDNESRLESYVEQVPDIAWDLMEVSNKPLTIIYPGAKNLAPNLVPEDGSIGIRIAKDPFCEELIKRFKKPIVSTSANISGEIPPKIFSDISRDIIKSVDYVVKYRQNDQAKGEASGIIKLGYGGQVEVIRE